MLDPSRLEEFIEQVRLTPAIWKNHDYGVPKEHLNEIWSHFGHTFEISPSEAQNQWKYLIRIHRFMNRDAKPEELRIPSTQHDDEWSIADSLIADSLAMFLKPALDELLSISKPTETSV